MGFDNILKQHRYDPGKLRTKLEEIEHRAFHVLLKMVNSGRALNNDEITAVHFLERCIALYYPFLRKHLGQLGSRGDRLAHLRKTTSDHFNTACSKCGRPLFRKGTVIRRDVLGDLLYVPSRCYRSGNRRCAEADYRPGKGRHAMSKVWKVGICHFCGATTLLTENRMIFGEPRSFCGPKHYQSLRRKLTRENKR